MSLSTNTVSALVVLLGALPLIQGSGEGRGDDEWRRRGGNPNAELRELADAVFSPSSVRAAPEDSLRLRFFRIVGYRDQ